jgi:hypothetical protein
LGTVGDPADELIAAGIINNEGVARPRGAFFICVYLCHGTDLARWNNAAHGGFVSDGHHRKRQPED